MNDLDEKDIKILEILERNARTPFVEIARHINVSEAAVRKRIRRLEEEGIILGYTVEVGPKLSGSTALVGVDTKPECYLQVLEGLKKLSCVKKLYTTTGDHMLMLEIRARNSKHLSEVISEISRMKGVTRACPAIILERVK